MAKRNRSANRPGQRRHGHGRPQQRPPFRPENRPEPRPSQSLSEAEEARAAELESEILSQERDGERARERGRERGRDAREARAPEPVPAGRGRSGVPLAVRAATEYAYVARDVRRILAVGGSMFAIMLVLFVLIRVLRVVSI